MFTIARTLVLNTFRYSLYTTVVILTILVPSTSKDSVDRPDPKGSADYFIQKYDCWTSEGPKNVVPGHAVITFPNGKTRYVGSLGVEAALQQIFADADYGLTVHAFCK